MQNYLLLGLGISNKSIKKFFELNNIKYLTYDDLLNINKTEILKAINKKTIIIKSNGISDDHEIIKYAQTNGITILSDLELFYKYFKCLSNHKIICVTGTNGKSTTVMLTKHLLENINLCGNIGIPMFDLLNEGEFNKDVIIEASSFMGEHLNEFSPDISCLLNINNHHLDRHKTVENYVKCKENIIKKTKGFLVYNYDDLAVRKLSNNIKCNKISYSINNLKADLYLLNNNIYYKEKYILSLSDLTLDQSIYNLYNLYNLYIENLLASIAIYIAYNSYIVLSVNDYIDAKHILNKLITFKGLEHRYEFVGKFLFNNKYIKVINDSKSTNDSALNKALSKLVDNTLIICGGKEEEGFELNINSINIKYIKLVLINGENRFVLDKEFKKYKIKTYLFETLEELLESIHDYLIDIDTIIFTPGSQSYDQFKNFEERGTFFKQTINFILNKKNVYS